MAEVRTDEEQVQALKEWWKENGKSLLVGVAAAAVAIFGWKTWQDNQAANAEAASITYQTMLEAAVNAISGEGDNESLLATATHLNDQLKTDFETSGYALLGALVQAKLFLAQGKVTDAMAELDWVSHQAPGSELGQLAQLRKARLLAAGQDYTGALSSLDLVTIPAYQASVQELRGDIYLAQGNQEQARSAYLAAQTAADKSGVRPLLNMKIDDLSVGD